MKKLTYEELERKFQRYCKHDGGRTWVGDSTTICAICGWDTAKCQHRGQNGKFCSYCGQQLLNGEITS